MVTSLSIGDRICVADCVTLTLLAIEGDLIRFGLESSEPGRPVPSVRLEECIETNLNGWDLNENLRPE